MRLLQVAAFLLLSTLFAQAQLPVANNANFRASLRKFQSQSLQWQNDLARIKVGELSISYSGGHLIEQDKQIAVSNLGLLSKLSARVLRTGRLSDEINLLETTHELSSNLQELVHALQEANVTRDSERKKIMDWSTPLSGLANGAVNTFYLNTFTYVTAHADEVEAGCPHSK